MEKSVDLGFLEECEQWLLKNKYFPSKVGGKPGKYLVYKEIIFVILIFTSIIAWLDLQNIPQAKELLCSICNAPCLFLCQIYAPLEDSDYAFHRTIYVFVCTNSGCYAPNSSRYVQRPVK